MRDPGRVRRHLRRSSRRTAVVIARDGHHGSNAPRKRASISLSGVPRRLAVVPMPVGRTSVVFPALCFVDA
eukprot:5304370-Pyramimonas_sp.AAC.1